MEFFTRLKLVRSDSSPAGMSMLSPGLLDELSCGRLPGMENLTWIQIKFDCPGEKKLDGNGYQKKLYAVLRHNLRKTDYWMLDNNTLCLGLQDCQIGEAERCIHRIKTIISNKSFLPCREKNYFLKGIEKPDREEVRRRIKKFKSTYHSAAEAAIPGNGRDRMTTGAVYTLANERTVVPAEHLKGQYFLKRSLDIVLSSLCLLLFSPLFLFISMAIFLESGRPVLFKQQRIGKSGIPFNMYKFRTMNKREEKSSDHESLIEMIISREFDADTVQKQYAQHIASHSTKTGRFLRKTSLDEIPQLINILKNEMSIVGPRPHPAYEVDKYRKWYQPRLTVKPGLTGLSKISLRFTPENYEEAMRYDLRYIKDWSIFLDLKIILSTFKSLIVHYE